jgi:hypothetical protein
MKTVLDTKTIANAFGTVTIQMWKVGSFYFIGRIDGNNNTVHHTSRDANHIQKLWKTV